MRGLQGWGGWQWLSVNQVSPETIDTLLTISRFLVEGTITGIVGIASWVLMPPGPTQTASWSRGKDGWFSEREEPILVNRLLRDDPSKGSLMIPSKALTWYRLLDYCENRGYA